MVSFGVYVLHYTRQAVPWLTFIDKNLEDRIVPTIIRLVPFSNVCADDGGFAQMSGRGLGSHVQAVRAVPSPGERSEQE